MGGTRSANTSFLADASRDNFAQIVFQNRYPTLTNVFYVVS
jgi:hypothetical protein